MKRYTRIFLFLICFLLLNTISIAQIVHLENPSFEGEPRDAMIPMSWLGCEDGTTPDILPGPWGVYLDPSEGESYLGLITRENFSWESIAQRLSSNLEEGECYAFSIDLAHSDTYSGYNNPVKLRIWGGKSKCSKDQLILETDFIKNIDWEKHNIEFTADINVKYIMLEAFYRERPFAYKGNILLDNMSSIKPCKRALNEIIRGPNQLLSPIHSPSSQAF